MKISEFGSMIGNDEVGAAILEKIRTYTTKGECVVVDFSGVFAMATYCAKQIFGALYVELGDLDFRRMVRFSENTTDDLRAVISEGIADAVASNRG